MRIVRMALTAACAAMLLGQPATAGGCPCPKEQMIKKHGTVSQMPVDVPLPPPLPPEKATLAAASG